MPGLFIDSYQVLYHFLLNFFKNFQKEEAKKPSKAKKAVSLFDEDDDEDLFGSITPVSTPSKPAQAEKQKKIEGSKQETKTEKKSDNLDIKPKATKKQKAKSFIDDDDSGLFGDDQDDLFTASSKVRIICFFEGDPRRKIFIHVNE